ncbi:MAG: glycosyltransferase family 4 protein [Candidatus Omnitrophota bacterium]|jgi:glycosyltransferase involved in cell wall biosynthesis|nr:glycosyltransferase family 4 protein [Candidatus Omnitrophota bacterium]MDD5518390.1 glycosyltransferase family 4 protein [Candidatus Omnitrophota bacterium]
MKILMCHKFHFAAGGAEVYLFDLCAGLKDLGHTVISFSTRNPRNLASRYSEYFVESADLSSIGSAARFVYSLESSRNIARLIDKYHPDLAHIHNIYHQISPSILKVLAKNRIPAVMTLHDYKLICPNYSLFTRGEPCERCKGGKYYNAVRYKCLKDSYLKSSLAGLEAYFAKQLKIYEENIALFIAPSRFLRDKMIKFGLDAHKVSYLPYAINLESFKPNFELGKYILYAGNLSVKKGIKLFLESLRDLSPAPAVKIAGNGPLGRDLPVLISRLGLKNVELLGFKSRDELSGIIRNALFVVVPSLWPEVSGLSIYEALSCGKCVVASDRGGIPELVEDKVNGLLFDPVEPGSLRDKINYLVSNPARIMEFGRNGFEKISRINNRKIHYERLSELYSGLVNKNSR